MAQQQMLLFIHYAVSAKILPTPGAAQCGAMIHRK
jgi:hypothetical protein